MNTLEDLRVAVRTRLGVPEADNFYTAPVLDLLINEAVQSIGLEADWPWMEASTTFATVSQQQEYDPATLVQAGHIWLRTRALTVVNDSSLEWRSLIEIREFGDDSGDPAFYTLTGDRLLLAPVPNKALTYTHDYIRQEPILVFNTDSPLMPIPFRYAIVHFACYLGHMRQNENQRAEPEFAAYEAWLKRMHDNRRRTTGAIRARVRPGRGSWNG